MGNNCFKREKTDMDILFEETIKYQIENYKPIVIKEYEDQPIVKLLSKIEIRDISLRDDSSRTQDVDSRIDDMQNESVEQQSLGQRLLQEIAFKTDYNQCPLSDWQLILDDTKTPCMIKVYLKQVQLSSKATINATRSEYIVPCKPKKYLEFMVNEAAQKQLDERIDEFKSYHSDGEESKVYLSYKKTFIIDARDFVYLKICHQQDQDKDIWLDASRSIVDKQYQNTGKTRGDIILSGTQIQPLANVLNQEPYKKRFEHLQYKAQSFSFVRVYSEIDFKINVPLFVAKGKMGTELQKYINLVYKQLQ